MRGTWYRKDVASFLVLVIFFLLELWDKTELATTVSLVQIHQVYLYKISNLIKGCILEELGMRG